jgi:hypothetical protein
MRALKLAVCAALTAAAPSWAAGGGGGHGGEATGPTNRFQANFSLPSDIEIEEQEHQQALDDAGVAGPRVVDIPTLSLPAFVDEELVGYFFVNVRVVVNEGVDAWKVRDKAHIIRDAMIRTGHARSIADPERPTRIDVERARGILMEGLVRVVPVEQIEKLEITSVDSPTS